MEYSKCEITVDVGDRLRDCKTENIHTRTTLYCSVLPTAWFNVFKLFKMLPHVSSVALADPSTSRQY